MKNILLILFLTCLSSWAQDPAGNNPVDPTAKGAKALTPPAFPTPPAPSTTRRPRGVAPAASSAVTPPAVTATPADGSAATPSANGLNPAAAVATTPGGASASAPNKPAETIYGPGDINFPSMKLDQFLEFYAKLVNRTVLHAQLPAAEVSLVSQTSLTTSEAIQAFESVLAMNGITVLNIGEKFVKAVPTALAGTLAAPFNTNDTVDFPESDQYVTQIAQLKYAKPTEVIPALTPFAQIPGNILAIDSSGILIIRDFASNVKRMMELLKQIDVTVPLDYESEVIPIKYALASDIASALSSLGGGTGTSIGSAPRSGGGGASGTRSGLGIGGGLGGGLGSSGFGGSTGFPGTSPTGITQPGGIGGGLGGIGGSRTSSFGDRLNRLVQRASSQGDFQILGNSKIIADQRTNSLLVFASKQDLEMIKKIISELDVVLAQVLIEAIIMEVTLDNSRTVGVSYLQNNPSSPGHYFNGIGGINNGAFLNPGNFINNGTNTAAAIPSGLSYFANFGGDFNATLTAIADNDRINVLSRPRIQTSHGVAASLQVGDTVPEVTGTYFNGIGGGGSSSQYQQTFVGINLQVTPLINPDGLVVMDIVQDVQQLGPDKIIDGNPVPTTSKRTAQATVSVRDHDTIILGGMISTEKKSSRSGVPFLKDIPGLGYLFRSSLDSGKRVELVVLIRPTVLPTPETAALVTAHERDKMPGIKAAERENRLDENRRLKESDKIKVPKERD